MSIKYCSYICCCSYHMLFITTPYLTPISIFCMCVLLTESTSRSIIKIWSDSPWLRVVNGYLSSRSSRVATLVLILCNFKMIISLLTVKPLLDNRKIDWQIEHWEEEGRRENTLVISHNRYKVIITTCWKETFSLVAHISVVKKVSFHAM